MAKKGPVKREARPKAPPLQLMDPRAIEKSMWDLERLLKTREFDTIEEMNAFLQTVRSAANPDGIAPPPPSTPVECAQEVMYQAWGARGRRRVELARKALSISEDCADAYVLLAEETDNPEEARDLYERGVKAGERALGPEFFQNEVGHFWGIVASRPYMRARAGLADVLWYLGKQQESIAHYQELLRLNPNDNQGLRYVLSTHLLEVGDQAALGKLLDQYKDDDSANWLYTRALWLFEQGKNMRRADAALRKAIDANPFVMMYLLGVMQVPDEAPEYMGFGVEGEALTYALETVSSWTRTENTLAWVLRVFGSALLEEWIPNRPRKA